VDAFQGGEKEIIIVSCCRTESLGFISSPNRMNVALTRARRHLILVGSGKSLPKNQFWSQIIYQARSDPGGYFNSREFQMSGFRYELDHGRNSESEHPSDSESCNDDSNKGIYGDQLISNESDFICVKPDSPTSSSQREKDGISLNVEDSSPPRREEEKLPVSAAHTALKQTNSMGREIIAIDSSKTRPAQRRTLFANFDLDESDDDDAQD
jgi:hypothetical protein